jgi:hypothetical protein
MFMCSKHSAELMKLNNLWWTYKATFSGFEKKKSKTIASVNVLGSVGDKKKSLSVHMQVRLLHKGFVGSGEGWTIPLDFIKLCWLFISARWLQVKVFGDIRNYEPER